MGFPDRFRLLTEGIRQRPIEDNARFIVGVDPASPDKAYFLPIRDNKVVVDGTFASTTEPPEHDAVFVDYYGSTNNIHHVVYKLHGNTVGTVTVTYVGGGAADNDKILSTSKDF